MFLLKKSNQYFLSLSVGSGKYSSELAQLIIKIAC